MDRFNRLAIGFCLIATCSVNHVAAATLTFDDLAPAVLPIPGSFQSGGIAVDLTDFGPGPGLAEIEIFNAPNQWLRLALSTAASVDVPPGVTQASFYYYNLVSLSSFTINGETISFEGLSGTTGTVGGVAYAVTANPSGTLDRSISQDRLPASTLHPAQRPMPCFWMKSYWFRSRTAGCWRWPAGPCCLPRARLARRPKPITHSTEDAETQQQNC